VILDNNELDKIDINNKIKSVSIDIEIRYFKQNPNLYNISATLEPISGPIKFIDISDL
jgi:hypothetical protein